MWEKIKEEIVENIIMVFWMVVALTAILFNSFIAPKIDVQSWLEVGAYVLGQHGVNSLLNKPIPWINKVGVNGQQLRK